MEFNLLSLGSFLLALTESEPDSASISCTVGSWLLNVNTEDGEADVRDDVVVPSVLLGEIRVMSCEAVERVAFACRGRLIDSSASRRDQCNHGLTFFQGVWHGTGLCAREWA
jgi:hypothetical protein